MKDFNKETQQGHRAKESVETKLLRIAEKAGKEKELKFNNIFQLMTKELLRYSFFKLRDDAAVGIDKRSKEDYAANLETNLDELERRLHRMSYIPLPSRRVWIPKPGSNKQRPLGIPVIEDKIVQGAMVKILEAIYEQDFIDDSHGFRPKRSCHKALNVVDKTIMKERVNYIVEADIKGFFDNVDHEWLMKFLGHRIADPRMLRMIKRFLISGVIEDGKKRRTDKGTPQGGVISPILANIYLHYALDLWFTKGFARKCLGYTKLIRYADDFIVCFEYKHEAERFIDELNIRLNKFKLETEPTKTKMLEFGKTPALRMNKSGRKLETFDFLGFTHYMGKARSGKYFTVKRITARKKFKAKLATFKEWMKLNRTTPIGSIMSTIKAKLKGHYIYYGISDNSRGIERFADKVKYLTHKWLNRRSQKKSMNWEQFREFWKRLEMPEPRIVVNLY